MPRTRNVRLDRESLRKIAGTTIFARGEKYFRDGLVGSFTERKGVVRGMVSGSEVYHVSLKLASQDLQLDCTCPYFRDEGEFCKHGVALGLAWLDEHSTQEAAPSGKSRRVTSADIKAHLASKPKDELVDLLVDLAGFDSALHRRFATEVATPRGGKLNLAEYRRAITQATSAGYQGFVPYREAADFERGIESVIDSIAQILRDHPAAVIELAEFALHEMEEAFNHIDDSDGGMRPLCDRLEELHMKACAAVKPDPVALAERLFRWESTGDWEIFFNAADRYKKILGRAGLERFHALAEKEWAKVPAKKPGARDTDFTSHFRIRSMMESLARASGSVDDLVRVMEKDLGSSWQHLRIAEVYHEAGRHDEALSWAERGLRDFSGQHDQRVADFLVREYARRKRHDDALRMLWASFKAGPDLETLKPLLAYAKKMGQRPAMRERAIAHLQSLLQPTSGKRRSPWEHEGSTLVEVFLWEKNDDAAWETAVAHDCSAQLWLRLAAAREKSHPEDAIGVYKVQAESSVGRKNNEGYRQSVAYIGKVRTLLRGLGKEDAFTAYLAEIKAAHRPKRNFTKLLEAAERNWRD